MLSLIAAIGKGNNVIGDRGKIPWHLPADFEYFKQTTLGKPVVMGANTHTSIGRSLPGRRNVVLASPGRDYTPYPGAEIASSFEEALLLLSDEREVFVIGGGEVYRQALPIADRLYITEVEGSFSGDVFFPNIDHELWREISRTHRIADVVNPHAMDMIIFERAV